MLFVLKIEEKKMAKYRFYLGKTFGIRKFAAFILKMKIDCINYDIS